MNEHDFITGYINNLVHSLLEKDFSKFISLIDVRPINNTIWIKDEQELVDWINNNGCDVPELENGEKSISDPKYAKGEPWNDGWLRVIEDGNGNKRAEVELAINGEWTDFHMYFTFNNNSERPIVSYVGIP